MKVAASKLPLFPEHVTSFPCHCYFSSLFQEDRIILFFKLHPSFSAQTPATYFPEVVLTKCHKPGGSELDSLTLLDTRSPKPRCQRPSETLAEFSPCFSQPLALMIPPKVSHLAAASFQSRSLSSHGVLPVCVCPDSPLLKRTPPVIFELGPTLMTSS